MQDSYKFKGLREKLVDSLQAKGIKDQRVLEAMKILPRHFFLESVFWHHAYQDKPFSIGFGQTISQPYTVARQSELLEVERGQKVLEIGTGSGYQAAILALLGAEVYSIELHEPLSQNAAAVLNSQNLKVKLFVGDGSMGLPTYAPYDKILVTAGATQLPKELLEQLKVGGILVIPLGTELSQNMLKLTRISETEFRQENFGDFVFVPLVGKYRESGQ